MIDWFRLKINSIRRTVRFSSTKLKNFNNLLIGNSMLVNSLKPKEMNRKHSLRLRTNSSPSSQSRSRNWICCYRKIGSTNDRFSRRRIRGVRTSNSLTNWLSTCRRLCIPTKLSFDNYRNHVRKIDRCSWCWVRSYKSWSALMTRWLRTKFWTDSIRIYPVQRIRS